MSHIDGTMEFTLRKPLDYSNGGNFEKATFLQLNEPTGKHNKNMRRLSAMVNSAFIELSKLRKDIEIDNEKVTTVKKSFSDLTEEGHIKASDEGAELIATAFSMSGDINKQEEFIEEFHNALIKDTQPRICLIMGHDSAPFLDTHWENLDYRDQIDLAVKYAAFFRIGSIWDMMEKSEDA